MLPIWLEEGCGFADSLGDFEKIIDGNVEEGVDKMTKIKKDSSKKKRSLLVRFLIEFKTEGFEPRLC